MEVLGGTDSGLYPIALTGWSFAFRVCPAPSTFRDKRNKKLAAAIIEMAQLDCSLSCRSRYCSRIRCDRRRPDERSSLLTGLWRTTECIERPARLLRRAGGGRRLRDFHVTSLLLLIATAASLVARAASQQPTPAASPPAADDVWIDLDENPDYTGRDESAFVQAGKHFLMMGGRQDSKIVDRYNFETDEWDEGSDAPKDFNHFQAVNYHGLIWVIGAFNTNVYPREISESNVYVYDPAADIWMEGPTIPPSRRRGAAGLVVYRNQFYLVGGNTNGHDDEASTPFLDRYNPRANTWTVLADAPRARDHFHAVVANDNKLYCIGGRVWDEVPEVDVYDFANASWTTLPNVTLPFPRAGAATVMFQGKILVIGGESFSQPGDEASDRVDAFDPVSGTFEQAASLNYGRHGTQAIVSGPGVIITGGSPTVGGGEQENMEAYSAYAPTGVASTRGVLKATISNSLRIDQPVKATIHHSSGNTGVIVQSITFSGTDASNFVLKAPPKVPFLIGTGESISLAVTYKGRKSAAVANLVVTYSGGRNAVSPLRGVCRPNRDKCTSAAQCCGGACDGPTPMSHACKTCRKRTQYCVRSSQCCSGLLCHRRACVPLRK